MALLRRYIPQILRSFGGNRMLSSVSRGREGPWLLMAPDYNDDEWLEFPFYSCTDGKVFNYLHSEERYRTFCGKVFNYLHSEERYGAFCGAEDCAITSMLAMETVGSSQGWMALYDSKKREAWLFDPTIYAFEKLPGMMEEGNVRSVILSERQGGKAFMIFGAASKRLLAFCRRPHHHEWRVFGREEGGYESIVYSSTRGSLLCLTSTSQVEVWDVDGGGGGAPRLASVTPPLELELEEEEQQQQLLKYIAEEEESGDLFVVVRRLKSGKGTVGFEVYKIGEGGNELMRMDGGLDGRVMVVGMNPAMVVKDGYAARLNHNSIYFAYDNRIRPGLDVAGRRGCKVPGATDLGIYDYETSRVSPVTPHTYYITVPPIWLNPPC